ncbi:MAG TPA: M1 family metallopeptidase [Actinomycetota bacterium]|nr:M1 family metallopeptidase [Actinomycetota bacterium]
MRSFPGPARVVVALAVSTVAVLQPVAASAAPVVRTPVDPRSVVELRTSADARTWRGTMSIAFTNADTSPLDEVYLRLWSNGVQGCDPLAIRVRNVSGGTADPPIRRCTAMRIALDGALAQGERGSVAFDLTIRVPSRNDRFGHVRGVSLLGSALPILAVRDDAGWNLPPFVDLGESFYSVAGTYRVTLDTPEAVVASTTGVRVSHRVADGRSTSTFVARNVRDFEWAAGPLRTMAERAGPTRVVVSYAPAVVGRADAGRVLAYAVRSMRAFARAFGPYPYPEVDVVVTGFTSFGGMEYPTLVFSNVSKRTVAHELAHQWWYGLVGNDQFSEPWLDEGLASWSETLPWHPRRSCGSIRWPSAGAEMTNDMRYWRAHPAEYGTVVYQGGGCMMAQLADGFGLRRFQRILARLATRFRYGVIRTEDLQRIVERAADRHWPAFPANFWTRWRVHP